MWHLNVVTLESFERCCPLVIWLTMNMIIDVTDNVVDYVTDHVVASVNDVLIALL